MLVLAAVMAAVAAALVAAIVAFHRHVQTPAWRTSEVRMASMRFLIIIAPFFGGRHDIPEPTPTSISTPGPDPEVVPPAAHEPVAADPRVPGSAGSETGPVSRAEGSLGDRQGR